MGQIIVIGDGNSPTNMEYYGFALITQRAGWTMSELGEGIEESAKLEAAFTKANFEKILKKVSSRVKK